MKKLICIICVLSLIIAFAVVPSFAEPTSSLPISPSDGGFNIWANTYVNGGNYGTTSTRTFYGSTDFSTGTGSSSVTLRFIPSINHDDFPNFDGGRIVQTITFSTCPKFLTLVNVNKTMYSGNWDDFWRDYVNSNIVSTNNLSHINSSNGTDGHIYWDSIDASQPVSITYSYEVDSDFNVVGDVPYIVYYSQWWNGTISQDFVSVNSQTYIGVNNDLSGVRPNTNVFSIPAGSCAIARIPTSVVASDSIYVSTTMASSRGVLSRSGGQSYYLSDVYFNEFDFGFFGEHGSTPISWTSDGTLFKKSDKYHSYLEDVNGFAYIYLSNPTTLDGSSKVNGSMYVSATFPFDWVKLKTFDDNPYSYSVYTESSPTFDSYSVYDSEGNQTALGWQESYATGASVVVPTSNDSTVINNYYGGQYASIPQQYVSFDSTNHDSLIGQINQFFVGRDENISSLVEGGQGFMRSIADIFTWLPVPVQALLVSALSIVIIIGVLKVLL